MKNHLYLSDLEYGVIMEAINNAKNAIAEDTFIDPYAENAEKYTNEDCLKALESVEQKIINSNIPF